MQNVLELEGKNIGMIELMEEKKLNEQIFYLALSTRRKFEKINKDITDGGREFPLDLCGSCAIVSAILFKVLKDGGYNPFFWCGENFCQGGGHCWVEVDGFIVDLTATQFAKKYKKVTVIPKDLVNKHKIYDFDQLNRHDLVPIKLAWEHQNPHSHLAKRIYRKFFDGLNMTVMGNKAFIKNMTF